MKQTEIGIVFTLALMTTGVFIGGFHLNSQPDVAPTVNLYAADVDRSHDLPVYLEESSPKKENRKIGPSKSTPSHRSTSHRKKYYASLEA